MDGPVFFYFLFAAIFCVKNDVEAYLAHCRISNMKSNMSPFVAWFYSIVPKKIKNEE